MGGVAADRLGGKPVQSVTLIVFAGAMLAAAVMPPSLLYWLYLFAGVCAGPQQPAYSAMTSAWFPQSQMGRVSAIADIATVGGEFFATMSRTADRRP